MGAPQKEKNPRALGTCAVCPLVKTAVDKTLTEWLMVDGVVVWLVGRMLCCVYSSSRRRRSCRFSSSCSRSSTISPFRRRSSPSTSTETGSVRTSVGAYRHTVQPPPYAERCRDPSVCLSVSLSHSAAALGYRHAGCLQLSDVPTADRSTDGRRSAASRTATAWGHIVSPLPGR